jgi:hypothetical protein
MIRMKGRYSVAMHHLPTMEVTGRHSMTMSSLSHFPCSRVCRSKPSYREIWRDRSVVLTVGVGVSVGVSAGAGVGVGVGVDVDVDVDVDEEAVAESSLLGVCSVSLLERERVLFERERVLFDREKRSFVERSLLVCERSLARVERSLSERGR